jgi:hypothetical protein
LHIKDGKYIAAGQPNSFCPDPQWPLHLSL